jgi:hypothetical protein
LPPRVALSARPKSVLSLICQVCAQCSASFCRVLDFVILLSLLPFCFPSHFPCPCSCCSPCNPVYVKRMRFCTRTGLSSLTINTGLPASPTCKGAKIKRYQVPVHAVFMLIIGAATRRKLRSSNTNSRNIKTYVYVADYSRYFVNNLRIRRSDDGPCSY